MIKSKYASLVFPLLIGAILRAFVAWAYPFMLSSDAPGYLEVARMIHSGNFDGYDAFRPPGYPFLIVVSESLGVNLHLIQTLMGLLSIVFVHDAMSRIGVGARVRLVSCSLLAVSIQFPFLEATMLTETMTSLFLTALAALVVRVATEESTARATVFAALAGCCAGVVALTHSLFAIAAGVIGLAMLARGENFRSFVWRSAPRAAAYVIPIVLMVGGWMLFNKRTMGEFAFTTNAGYTIINHVLPVIASATNEDAVSRTIRREYQKSETLRAETDDNRSLVTSEITTSLAKTQGWPRREISRRLQSASMAAIRQNPGAYAESVAKAWLRYWRVPLTWEPDNARSDLFRKFTSLIWWLLKCAWFGIEIALVAVAVFALVRWRGVAPPHAVLAWAIIAVSVVQALLQYADNSRYAEPAMPVMLVVVAAACQQVMACASQPLHCSRWFRKS